MRINATVVSVQEKKSKTAYGQLGKMPMRSGGTTDAAALVRARIPADVPDNAIVTKAELVFYASGDWPVSLTYSAQRNAAPGFRVSHATWDNSPALSGTVKTTTVTNATDGQEFRINVTDHVQLFVSGAATDNGWRLSTSATVNRKIFGSVAAKNKPWLDLEYVEPGDPPVDLVPDGGAVSIAKPTLTFDIPGDDAVSIQVQIDAAANAVSPGWDSGEVFSAVGMLDLTATTYPGLSVGATTFWRARYRDAFGWSDWSSWASFPRIAKPTVAITSPGATTGDKTPPISWTASGQVTWKAELLDAVSGQVIDDSEKTTSADHDWTPTKGLSKVGQVGRARVRVWDGVDRAATPGDPMYSEATFDFQLVAIGSAPGVDSLTATQVGPTPVVRLAWSGPEADLFKISRDGEWIDEVDGALAEYEDLTAAPLVQHVYQVLVATDTGLVSPNGPTATITPRPAGVWLIDPESDAKVLILEEEIETTMAEQAILHTIVGDNPPVRRRSGTPPPSGTVSGFLLNSFAEDYPAVSLADAALTKFKGADQGQVFRLAMGAWNIPVTIGDLTVGPALLDDSGQPCYTIGFSWWQTRDELPWDA